MRTHTALAGVVNSTDSVVPQNLVTHRRSCRMCLRRRSPGQAGVRSIEHGNWMDEATGRALAAAGAFLVPTTIT